MICYHVCPLVVMCPPVDTYQSGGYIPPVDTEVVDTYQWTHKEQIRWSTDTYSTSYSHAQFVYKREKLPTTKITHQ